MSERLQAEARLMRNTLSELASLLDAAHSKAEILSNLEEMPIKGHQSLVKAIDTADGIVVMLLAKDVTPKPTMEEFGQRFVGIVDTYPLLSVAVVEQAAKDFEVYTRNNDVVLEFKGLPGGMGFYQELPPEYAYALFIRLQRILFGSNPDAGFGSKP